MIVVEMLVVLVAVVVGGGGGGSSSKQKHHQKPYCLECSMVLGVALSTAWVVVWAIASSVA